MNLYRLNKWTIWTTVAITITAACFEFTNSLIPLGWWWLTYIPIVLLPPFAQTVVQRKAWKNATFRGVLAVLDREITAEEKEKLEARNYKVQNMYVTGVNRAPCPPDAGLLLYQDLADCMDTPFGVEDISSRSIGTTRRVATFVGRMDDFANTLMDLHEQRHGRHEP
jgi:hypothetical protein